jgi:hypothetical protein
MSDGFHLNIVQQWQAEADYCREVSAWAEAYGGSNACRYHRARRLSTDPDHRHPFRDYTGTLEDATFVGARWPGIVVTGKPLPGLIRGSGEEG